MHELFCESCTKNIFVFSFFDYVKAVVQSQTKVISLQKGPKYSSLERAGAILVEKHVKILNSPDNIEQKSDSTPLEFKKSVLRFTDEKILKECLPETMMKKLVKIVNYHFDKQYDDGEWKATSVAELTSWYRLHMMIESTYANGTKNLRKHFADLKKLGFSQFSLVLTRFEQIKHALKPKRKQLKKIAGYLSEAAIVVGKYVFRLYYQ